MTTNSPKYNIGHDRQNHLTYICILSIFLIVPFFLRYDNTATEETLSLFGQKMPAMCVTKKYTDMDCPGCGLTRSFTMFAHGRWRDSIHYHRIGFLLYLFFLGQLLFRFYALFHLDKEIALRLRMTHYYGAIAIIAALIINWAIGLGVGSNGS